MKQYVLCLFILSLLGFVLIFEANAATVNARSCSASDVQAAVNSASDGDTVIVPPGTCTWSSTVTLPNTKGLIVQGAGVDATVINSSGVVFMVNTAVGRFTRITGFTLSGGRTLYIQGTGKSWRVDHNKFPGGGPDIWVYDYNYGLIDHNIFVGETPKSCIRYSPGAREEYKTADGGAESWRSPTSLGTADALHVENNEFLFDRPLVGYTPVDGRSGARFVFRYNTVKNTILSWHDAEIGGNRGTRQIEVYNNNFQFTSDINNAVFHRGGTGVWFDNTFRGTRFTWANTPIILRSTRTTSVKGSAGGPWDTNCNNVTKKFCLGGSPMLCNSDSDCFGINIAPPCVQLDGQADSYGYRCRDQIGAGQDNPATGVQASEPMWFWNNKWCTGPGGNCTPTSDVTLFIHNNGSENIIVKGRDYYESSSDAKPGYAPYIYPHPLAGAVAGAKKPNPPSTLR